MKSLIGLCAGRPVMVIMMLAALLLGAVFSLSRLSLNRLPELRTPRVTVETIYPGMGAADVRSIVTIPLEDALSPVKGLERIRSVSRDGASAISLDFRWGTDPQAASVLVREAIDAAYPALPEGVRKPAVLPGESAAEPQGIIAVFPRNGDGVFARNLAEYELRSRLRRLDGAGSVILVGGKTDEARIRLDIPRLVSRGIDAAEFARLLSAETADVPAGSVRDGGMELVVVSAGRPESPEELAALTLPVAGGPLRPLDAGETGREPGRLKSLFIFEGREAAALEIYRRPGANPVKLSRDIQKMLEEIVPLFSRDAEIRLVYDSSGAVLQGVLSLGVSALLGAVAVTGTLIFFIRRIRWGLLTALSIPVSASAGIIALALSGRSLNSMSLGGLALGIGLVSDTAVIVLDLLHRRFRGLARRPLPAELAGTAASVAGSSLASMITTAVVFIPVIFLPGPLGSLFGDTSIALVSSIAAGWFYAQFCFPALYRIFFRLPDDGALRNDAAAASPPARNEQLAIRYGALLKRSLRRPLRVLAVALITSSLGAALLLGRPAAFVSPDAAAELGVSLVFPPGVLLESAASGGRELSRILAEIPGITTAFARAGSEDEDLGRRADTDYRKEELRFRCMLQSGADPEKVLGAIQERLASLGRNSAPGPSFPEGTVFSAFIPQDETERLLGLSSAHTLAVSGVDREETESRARLAAARIKKDGGSHVSSIEMRPSGLRPELRFFPNREAAAHLGISILGIAGTLQTITEGVICSRLEIEGRPLDVRVSGQDLAASDGGTDPESALTGLSLPGPQGGRVFLGSLGRVEQRDSEAALARFDRGDVIYLDARPSPGQGKKLSAGMQKIAGEFSWLSRADESAFTRYRTSLFLTLAMVLVLLYMTMGAQFESLLLPLILMMSIPFSLAGTGPALFLAGARLDSGAVLGLTVLFGLVVNNGIILYETAFDRIRSGMAPAAAVFSGAQDRFSPVLITTLTTCFALLPLIVTPLGSTQKSMAVAMAGGVISATLLTLFALPPVFVRYFRWSSHE
ncbi:MAG: efflux RND transporter permease subunit [Treponema sp.]|nr:efflux RND transporter permease subunit [Treponema sp.]